MARIQLTTEATQNLSIEGDLEPTRVTTSVQHQNEPITFNTTGGKEYSFMPQDPLPVRSHAKCEWVGVARFKEEDAWSNPIVAKLEIVYGTAPSPRYHATLYLFENETA